DGRDAARRRGRAAGTGFVLSSLADVLVAGIRERARELTLGRGSLVGIGADLRHGLRALRRAPTYTIVCLTSLAIGIAINALLVLSLDATFDPPRAVRAEGAVELIVTDRASGALWSYPDVVDVRRGVAEMDVAAWALGTRAL